MALKLMSAMSQLLEQGCMGRRTELASRHGKEGAATQGTSSSRTWLCTYRVWNPIIIDQNYCYSATPCEKQKSAVEVSNVLFKNIRGTSASTEAIKLCCSTTVPCHGIALENVKLTLEGGNGVTTSACENAKWVKSGTVAPQPSCTLRN
ncbi:polygalacturonase [Panicum miliaceum]|uniref:Polygalacturonase n=1 Tax=Panicum miliaceum TaxID=4540 RepID=A0A3L6Q6X3_PANMI|nr:polygalacturonase [Panicum miliaceum]